jgi:hypothetical protein
MRGSVKRVVRAVAAAVAVGAVLTSAAPVAAALPFGKVVVRHADFSVGFNQFKSATAHCPAGDRLVSGGVQMLGDSTAQSSYGTYLGSSFPTSDLKGWTGSAGTTSNATYTFRVIVHCAPSASLPTYTVVRKVANLANRLDEKYAVAYCPTNTRAVAGGTQYLPENTATPKPTYPGATTGSVPFSNLAGWLGIGRNVGGIIGPERAMRLRVVAVCAKAVTVGKTTNDGYNFSGLPSVVAVAQRCNNNHHAVAGGMFFNNGDQVVSAHIAGRLVASYPTNDGAQWATLSNDEGGGASRALYVYCASV